MLNDGQHADRGCSTQTISMSKRSDHVLHRVTTTNRGDLWGDDCKATICIRYRTQNVCGTSRYAGVLCILGQHRNDIGRKDPIRLEASFSTDARNRHMPCDHQAIRSYRLVAQGIQSRRQALVEDNERPWVAEEPALMGADVQLHTTPFYVRGGRRR